MNSLLVVESQPSRRLVLRRFLSERGIEFRLGDLTDLLEGAQALIVDPHQVVEAELSSRLRAALESLPVIWSAPLDEAAAAELPAPLAVLDPALDLEKLGEVLTGLVAPVAGLAPADVEEVAEAFVAEDATSRELLESVDRLAGPDVPVLLVGESGTGKEILARRLHERSSRATEPFVAVHCGAIPAELLESELFGHEKGSFTDAHRRHRGHFERVGAGTIFLDEIGEMPVELQPKLLRVLESRELTRVGGESVVPMRARVVSATHRDLVRAMDEGWFRRDLYHRLAVATVEIPPLRRRPADLRRLTRLFLRRFALEQGVPARGLSPEGWQLLRDHAWPGNVRELENALRRAVLLQSGPVLQADQFPGLGARPASEDQAWARALQRWLEAQPRDPGSPEALARSIRGEVDRILADWASREAESPEEGEEKEE